MPSPLADMVYDIPVLGPIGVAFNTLTATWIQVLPADPVRRGVIFANPSLTATLRVAPATLAAQNNAGALLIYPQSEYAVWGEPDNLVRMNSAWMAWSDGAGPNPISILNFTDNNPAQAAQLPLIRQGYEVPITSPLATGVSLTTNSVQVIAANPMRRGIKFQNPSDVVIYVCPANLTAIAGAGSIPILPGAEKTIIARGRIRVNCGWKAIAASGSGKPLTIFEYV